MVVSDALSRKYRVDPSLSGAGRPPGWKAPTISVVESCRQSTAASSSSGGSASTTSHPAPASACAARSIASATWGSTPHPSGSRTTATRRAPVVSDRMRQGDRERVAVVSPVHQRERGVEIVHAAGDRAVDGEELERQRHRLGRPTDRCRDAARRRSQRADAGSVRGQPQRPAVVVAESEGRHAGRDRHGVAAAGPTRHPRRGPTDSPCDRTGRCRCPSAARSPACCLGRSGWPRHPSGDAPSSRRRTESASARNVHPFVRRRPGQIDVLLHAERDAREWSDLLAGSEPSVDLDAARARARSANTTVIALTTGLTSSMRAR